MKVIISGYGRMGHMIETVLGEKGIELALASEDIRSVDPSLARECVCIDFTTPAAIHENYRFIAENFKAAVIGTTGWGDIKEDVLEAFRESGCTLIYGSNFSIGVNILFQMTERLRSLSERFPGMYEPHLTEVHHIHKLDAPSGTAVSIAQIFGSDPNEIESIRQGEVPGIHTLTLTSSCDRITLSHEAFSREGFARGAVEAAILSEKLSGVHEFKDIIFEL